MDRCPLLAAEESVQRRFAAILAADVAGYSRLMGEDEEGMLAALTAPRVITAWALPVTATSGSSVVLRMCGRIVARIGRR